MIVEIGKYFDYVARAKVLIEYNTKTKEYKILYTIAPCVYATVEYIYDNEHLVLKLKRIGKDGFYYAKYTLNKTAEVVFSEYNIEKFYENFIVLSKDNKKYFIKSDSTTCIELGEFLHIVSYKYIESSNFEYLVFASQNFTGNEVSGVTLYAYNLNTNELEIIKEYTEYTGIDIINEEYIMLYNIKGYEYIEGKKSSFLHAVKAHLLSGSNVLAKVNYSLKSIEIIYTFEREDISYVGGEIKNNKYYVTTSKVFKGNKLISRGIKYKDVSLDLSTFKLKKLHSVKIEDDKDKVKCGEYEYYVERVFYNGVFPKNTAYYLCRVDNKNKQKVMQYFTVVDNEIEGTRYSEKMVNEYITQLKNNDFIILDH